MENNKDNKKRKINNQSGAAMLISVIFFLFISVAIIAGLVSPSVRGFQVASADLKSKSSYFLAESGVEDAYFRLKNAKPIGTSVEITLDGNTVTTDIIDSGYNEKTITSTGDVFNRNRKGEMKLTTGTGISFAYGIQAGTGGFSINKAIVNGNVFANGDIIGTHGDATIRGTAISAGAGGFIDNINIGNLDGTGIAQAHTVTDSTMLGNLYCQVGSGNNKICDTSLVDPDPVPMPVTEEMITQWKADAELGGVVTGDLIIADPTQFGPKKITGNLTINDDLTITGTIYVAGRIIFKNGVNISLSPSFGATGGIIVTDDYVDLSNNVIFEGSGSEGSYILLLTTSSCPDGCSGIDAIGIYNNAQAVILNAQNGTAHIHNNVTLNEIVAKKIVMDNGAEVNYLTGLANTQFTSGPTGGWNINSWKEVE
ncbi:MAG: hypothetical protein ABH951_01860 [Patescibacteria group bacterium]